MSLRDVIELKGLAAARDVVRRMHLRTLDRAALAMAASSDLELDGPAGPLRARLYVPAVEAAAAPGPLLVYFHGGGFVLCDIESHDALCRRLAAAAGMRILSVEYRLAPEHRFPAMHEDAAAAWAWARDHAAELGADPGRIGLGGDSAGGHMALWLALRARDRPAFLALLYPLLNVAEDQWAGDRLRDLRFIGRAAVAYIRRQIADYEAAGGLNDFGLDTAEVRGMPPTVVAVMGLDPLRPGIERFCERLRAAGTDVEVVRCPTLAHGAFNFAYVSRKAAHGLQETGEILSRAIGS